MREIKFRGKVLKSSNWAYGDLHILSDMPHIHTAPSVFPYMGKAQFVDINTIGQFTGLKDINGVDIYDGDIVRVRTSDDRYTKNPTYRVGVIKYDDQYHGCWEVSCYYRFLPKRMEVIGNIYDNPELLEGGVK